MLGSAGLEKQGGIFIGGRPFCPSPLDSELTFLP